MGSHRPAYFSHDADARNDVKCLALRQKHGYEGYGIFWAIIEVLRVQPNYAWDANALQLLCICIACDMQLLTQVFDTCIQCGLLTVIGADTDAPLVTSPSLHRRMAAMEEISEKRREAAKKRHDANALQLQSKSSANAPKIKRKVKDNTPLPPKGFDVFYAAYPVHSNRADAVKAFAKLDPSPELLANMLEAISAQKAHRAKLKAQNKFSPEWPYPASWLNGRRWEDEVGSGASDTGIPETSHLPMWVPGQSDV